MIATQGTQRKKQDPIPSGMHIATCYAVCDLGTHHDDRFDKDKREVLLIWEVPKHRIDIERDGETKSLPRAISKRYTLSLSEKANLRKELESWRGRGFTADELKGFDMRNILGKPCLLNVTHNHKDENTYANISSITPLMDGMEAPEQENPSTYFTFDKYDVGTPMPDGMPNWAQEIAKESFEYNESPKTEEKTDDVDESSDSSRPF